MTADQITAPSALQRTHQLDGFTSGAVELDEWLVKYGWANHATGNARVFVACRGVRVVGYYTLSTAGAVKANAPADLLRGGAPSEVPCLLLGRLAVEVTEQGQNLGKSMLIDALRRTAQISNEVGVRALLIHARDEAARSWYLRQARTFQASPTDPMQLFLPIKELRRMAGAEEFREAPGYT